jgi:hypothetical protein
MEPFNVVREDASTQPLLHLVGLRSRRAAKRELMA